MPWHPSCIPGFFAPTLRDFCDYAKERMICSLLLLSRLCFGSRLLLASTTDFMAVSVRGIIFHYIFIEISVKSHGPSIFFVRRFCLQFRMFNWNLSINAFYCAWCHIWHGEFLKYVDFSSKLSNLLGLPKWLSGQESACQCRRCKRCGFDPGIRKALE